MRTKNSFLDFRHRLREIAMTYKIALTSNNTSKLSTLTPLYVAMVDGSAKHGGMCDRFKGIITLYAYCKYRKIPFRIKYTYPFRLEDYLAPATYDWTLKEGEYTDNPQSCRVLYMRKEQTAKRLLGLRTNKQVHFYGNRDSLDYINEAYAATPADYFDWGELYRELFKPGEVLEGRIKTIKQDLGNDYYAAVFRFQNLLGDFKEYDYQPIKDKSKSDELINKCLDAIRKLQTTHVGQPLLVTSDSVRFLQVVSQVSGVHIIPGTLQHMDSHTEQRSDNAYEVYLKSFLDFYLLSEAQEIYRIGASFMYPTKFPIYAAKVHNIPFYSITI